MPALIPQIGGLCSLTGIVSFRPGTWNGIEVSEQDERDMVANFAKYSTGDSPYYSPYISINHKDELKSGSVSNAYMQGDRLVLDGKNIPSEVGEWIESHQIEQPSIEFWKPTYENGKIVEGFMCPDGQYSQTCVLKCVTFLGNDAPAVKGLPNLPMPAPQHQQFSHRKQTAKALTFACTAGMGDMMGDRAQMLAALQAMGFDTTSWPDTMPDEVIASILKGVQAQSANPANAATGSATTNTGSPDPAQMNDGNPISGPNQDAQIRAIWQKDPKGLDHPEHPDNKYADKFGDQQNLPNDNGRGSPVQNHDSQINLPMGADGNVVKAADGTGGMPNSAQTQLDGSLPADDGMSTTGIMPSTMADCRPSMGSVPKMGTGQMNPKQTTVIHKFSDSSGKTPATIAAYLAQMADAVNRLAASQNHNAAILANQQQNAMVQRRQAKVLAFADRARKLPKPPAPILITTLCRLLLTLDDNNVLKFADGKTGTVCDQGIREAEASLVPSRTLGDKLANPHPGQPKITGSTAAISERAKAMIAKDPLLQDINRAKEKKERQANR